MFSVVAYAISTSHAFGYDLLNTSVNTVAWTLVADRAIRLPWRDQLPSKEGEHVRAPYILTFSLILGITITLGVLWIDKIVKFAGMDQAVQETIDGSGNINDPTSWRTIFTPNTYPVKVSVAREAFPSDSPTSAGNRVIVDGVLMGQANSTTVIWWPKKQQTLRLPSAATSITLAHETFSRRSG